MAEVCSPLRIPLIAGNKKPAAVTEDVCRPMLRPPSALWWADRVRRQLRRQQRQALSGDAPTLR